MKTHFTVALTLSAGVAIGALAVQALHAQAKPPTANVENVIGQITPLAGNPPPLARRNHAVGKHRGAVVVVQHR